MVTIGNSVEENGLGINTDHEALVALIKEAVKSGFACMAGEKGILASGERIVRELEVSEDYRMRTEGDNLWFTDINPPGTAINTSIWKSLLTTQTLTLASGRYELNSSGINTASTGSMLQSWATLPQFKANASYAEIVANWTLHPVANWFAEWGFGDAATAIAAHANGVFFRITAGQFRGVIVNAGVESYVDLDVGSGVGVLPATANVHDCIVELTMDKCFFWVDGILAGKINTPATQFSPTALPSLQLFARTYNAATAPAAAIKLQISAVGASNGGADLNRLWATVLTAAGFSSIQGPTGATVGQTSNNANSAAPSAATLSNTAAGYTTLGGQFSFAAVAGAETDYALFGYQVPANKRLIVRGVWIDTINTGAAVATTPTTLQWAIAVGSNAVTLANAEAAAAKAPRKLSLGIQSFVIGAAIGAQAPTIGKNLDAPLVVNGGEFLHIILKMPFGTATASQVIRGIVGVNGCFE